jgi:hypothetical protein
MPIPSHNFGAELFLSELSLQCDLFERAMNNLKIAAEHWKKLADCVDDGKTASPLQIVSDCTVCLSSMAAVRRILYPNKKASVLAKSRASAILNVLEVPTLVNVTSVDVRNSWEHFDERLDKYLTALGSVGGSIAELHVSVLPLNATTTVLRRFDPIELAIYFAGDKISLRPAAAEMKDLSERIHAAYSRLQTEHVNLQETV